MNMYVAIALVVMVAVIVTVDIVFLRDQFWKRLLVNICIVLVFMALYFTVLRNL